MENENNEYKVYQAPLDLWKKIPRIVEIACMMMNKNEINKDLIQEIALLLSDKEVTKWLDGIAKLKEKGVLKK